MTQGKLGSTVISWTVVYPEPACTGHDRMREMASSLCNTIWGGQAGVNNVSKRCGFHKKKLWMLPDLLVSSPHPHFSLETTTKKASLEDCRLLQGAPLHAGNLADKTT